MRCVVSPNAWCWMLLAVVWPCLALDDLQRVDWRPERGWYFYARPPSQALRPNPAPNEAPQAVADLTRQSFSGALKMATSARCQHPNTWEASCGFIDPTTLALSSHATYQFEQQQYHGLMRHYALYPNDPKAVYGFQQFNRWVLHQAMTAAYTWQYNLVQHPALAASVPLPLSQFGEQVLRTLEDRSEQQFWRHLAATSFFMLVSRSQDPACLAQGRVVRLLQRDTGVTVWDVSLDAGQLPGAQRVLHYPALSRRQRQALANHLQLDWLPTLYLYLKPAAAPHPRTIGQWIRITNGLTPLNTIKARTLNFVIAYRHAMVQGAAQGQHITPDFSHHHLYPLVNPVGAAS